MSFSKMLYEDKQERIEELQNKVWKRRITEYGELKQECEKYGLDAFDDVLAPMGWNFCDRCEALEDSEVGLAWLDGFDFDENDEKDKAILDALKKEKIDYCAVCWDCFNELGKSGGAKP